MSSLDKTTDLRSYLLLKFAFKVDIDLDSLIQKCVTLNLDW